MSEKFGMLILHLREQKGLTQKEVGDKCGVTYVAVGDWERGRRLPRVRNLKGLAAALGVPESTLTDAIYATETPPSADDSGESEVSRNSVLNLDDYEGFSELDEEARADVAEDVALAIQRARNRQRRRENLGGSRAGRDSD